MNTQIARLKKQADAFSPATIRQELTTMCAAFGVVPNMDNVEYSASNYCGEIKAAYFCLGQVDYDLIMPHTDSYIGCIESIDCVHTKSLRLVSRGDTKLIIKVQASCDLPKEDLDTLRMLGKVKTETHNYSSSSTSETVSCNI